MDKINITSNIKISSNDEDGCKIIKQMHDDIINLHNEKGKIIKYDVKDDKCVLELYIKKENFKE